MAQLSKKHQDLSKIDKNLINTPSARNSENIGEENEIKKLMQKKGALTVDEALKLIENIQYKGKIIKKKLDELFEKRGVTPEYLRAYINNPNNFSLQEWESFKKEEQDYINSLKIPTELKHITQELLSDISSNTYHPPTQDAERRLKMSRSSRRRLWIPVR